MERGGETGEEEDEGGGGVKVKGERRRDETEGEKTE